MDNRPILYLDSGIGGLPYFQHGFSMNPHERFIYVADRENFPYGPKSKDLLVPLLTGLIERLINLYDPKVIVIACNTATVSALEELRRRFPLIPFIGTVPAVKPAVLESGSGVIGVLGTARTVEDPYINGLVEKYRPGAVIKAVAAPELVDFVENDYARATLAEKERIVSNYMKIFRAAGADAVVLGCTHFLFLIDEFRKAALPEIKVYDSVEGVSLRLAYVLDDKQLRADAAKRKEKNMLIVTGSGPVQHVWKERAEIFGLNLLLLNDCPEKGEP